MSQLPIIEAITTDVLVPSTKQIIKIKQMRTKDEKIILSAKAESGNESEQAAAMLRAIIQVVQNNIVTPNINVEELAGIDVEWLFIKLRELSVANKVESSYRDNEEMFEYQQALEKWNDKHEGQEPVEPEAYKFDIDLSKVAVIFPDNISQTIEGNGYQIKLRYPPASIYTSKDFMAITDGVKMLDTLIKSSIVNISQKDSVWNVKDISSEDWQKFLDELPISSYNKLKEFLSNMPVLFYEIKYKNKNGHERSIKLTRLTDFFTF